MSGQKMSPADAGRLGARKRWGPTPRIVRLDDPALSPEGRRLLLAFLAAAKAEAATDTGQQ